MLLINEPTGERFEIDETSLPVTPTTGVWVDVPYDWSIAPRWGRQKVEVGSPAWHALCKVGALPAYPAGSGINVGLVVGLIVVVILILVTGGKW